MTFSIDAGTVVAACAAMTLLGTVFAIVTRAIVRDEIKKINGTYLRSTEAIVRFAAIDKEIEWLKEGR